MNAAHLDRVARRQSAALCRLHWEQSGAKHWSDISRAKFWLTAWNREHLRVKRALATIDTLTTNYVSD